MYARANEHDAEEEVFRAGTKRADEPGEDCQRDEAYQRLGEDLGGSRDLQDESRQQRRAHRRAAAINACRHTARKSVIIPFTRRW